MNDLLLAEHLGIVRRAQLLASGTSPEEVRRLLASGTLQPLARGWYAGASAHQDAARALRAGGAFGCLSALAHHGVWIPPTRTLHVRRSRHHMGKKVPPGVKQCQHRSSITSRVTRPVDGIGQALLSALHCVTPDEAVAIMDSILNQGLLTLEELAELLAGERKPHRDLLTRVDGRAESGTESLTRRRLARLGINAQPQVAIAGIGRVDLLVGDLLVIEVDSVAHHTSLENYRKDRGRDFDLVALGYVVVRLTYEDVMDDWPAAQEKILILLRARRHKGALIG